MRLTPSVSLLNLVQRHQQLLLTALNIIRRLLHSSCIAYFTSVVWNRTWEIGRRRRWHWIVITNQPTHTRRKKEKNIRGVFSLILLKILFAGSRNSMCNWSGLCNRKAPTTILHTDVRIYQELLSIVKGESVHRLEVWRSIRLVVVVVVSGFRYRCSSSYYPLPSKIKEIGI